MNKISLALRAIGVITLLVSIVGEAVGFNQPLPDKDNDGIPDDEDRCENVKGVEERNGCPSRKTNDADGDGVIDREDECPDTYGNKINGCPIDQGGSTIPLVIGSLLFASGIGYQYYKEEQLW